MTQENVHRQPTKRALKVAIIGRPNVGKSTLFNRLVGKKLALVDDQPGVTRDRRYGHANLSDLSFDVIDTAGMEEAAESALETRMMTQTKAAIAESDVVLFMIDARAGVLPADQTFARAVRESGKPVILVANKAEGRFGHEIMSDAYGLGFDNIALISAEHGEGMADLFDALMPLVEQSTAEAQGDKPLQLVIIGRPNAGKSTLINQLLGEDRLLTGPEAGITRDAISVPFDYAGIPFQLVDTAGIRKRANVRGKIEKLAVADALRALIYAEVVVVLIDATAPLEKQDAAIASLVEREGRACVIGINKWDLVKGDKKAWLEEFRWQLDKQLFQMAGILAVPVSAAKGQGLEKLLDACIRARDTWEKRIGTAELNRWLEGMLQAHTPPMIRGRRLKIKYITQLKGRPPTFQLFTNMASEFPDAYLRYLIAGLRKTFDLPGTPIRLGLKESNNPFDKKKRKR